MIKRFILLSALVLIFPWSAPAESDHEESALSLKTTDGFEIGAQVSSYTYEEPGLMDMKGAKLGLTGSAAKNLGNDWYAVGDARFAFGEVEYTGSGTKSGNPDQLWDLRVVGGRDFAAGGPALSPYAGLGYRTLFNDLRGATSTGAAGYRRTSEYVYLPLGVTHRFQTNSVSRISTSLEYDYLISGRQTTYLSDVDAGLGDPVNQQKNGYGVRLSSAYEKKDWSVGFFYYYWNIAESEKHYLSSLVYVYEPKNNTNEYGVQVKYRF